MPSLSTVAGTRLFQNSSIRSGRRAIRGRPAQRSPEEVEQLKEIQQDNRFGAIVDAIEAALTPPFVDTTALVKGSADGTKKVRIEADALTTATTRVIEMPDQNVSLDPGWEASILAGQVFGP